MSDAPNLLRLFNSAPKNEKNRFVPDPRTDAFFEGLARSKPLTPPQLLELADNLSKHRSPVADELAGKMVLQAIGDVGHNRRMLEILSKVADEQTSWGLSVRELLAKMTGTYQGLSPRFSIGTIGGGFYGGALWTYSYATTAPGSGCTYQPPSGLPITLAPKQRAVFNEGCSVVGCTIITVSCVGFPPEQSLIIETATRHF